MSDTQITRGEFAEANRRLEGKIDSLSGIFREGIKGTHERLDKVNGRLEKQADQIADLRQQTATHAGNLKNLNNEVFEKAASPAVPPELIQQLAALVKSTAEAENQPALTVRDVRVLGAFGKAIWALGGFIAAAAAFWLARGSQ